MTEYSINKIVLIVARKIAMGNETAMKAKKQASERTPFNDDDQCKLIMQTNN